MAKDNKTGRQTTYRDFLALMSCASALEQERQMEILKGAPCPAYLCDIEVPQNLNGITFGQLDEIGRAGGDSDPAAKSLEVILGLTGVQIYGLNVFDVFGFANMCAGEYRRINGLFSALKVNYNSDEIQAGINEMSYGTFGVADWYARRMGIANQNDVYSISWVRIYQCMKMDIEGNNYERRLNKVMSDRMKSRNTR